MKRNLILGIGCLSGVITGRILMRGRTAIDGEALVGPPITNLASIAAATGIAGRVSDSFKTDPDDLLITFGVGFTTGAILTVFAGPIARALGSLPAKF